MKKKSVDLLFSYLTFNHFSILFKSSNSDDHGMDIEQVISLKTLTT
ncbi:hypothetical protein [Empedobacter brevis]